MTLASASSRLGRERGPVAKPKKVAESAPKQTERFICLCCGKPIPFGQLVICGTAECLEELKKVQDKLRGGQA